MIPENVTRILKKYKRRIPKNADEALRPELTKLPDESVSEFAKLPTKSIILTFVLSVFLGGIGLDRFYLKDNSTGFTKLIFRLITVGIAIWVSIQFADIRGMVVFSNIINTAVSLWCIADIYYTNKLAKERNITILTEFVHQQQR